ncbi:MAG: hypothetical protein ACJAT2_000869 [Bacteriovoracaceae bacterium]|jgi:hypothetical protein
MKFIFTLAWALALTGIAAPKVMAAPKVYEKSIKIWKSFYPDHDCSKLACAKNVPPKALEALLEKGSYFHPSKLTNANWMMVADFTLNSKKERGFLINTKTGAAELFHVSHGKGSGDGAGNAIRFSNRHKSYMSSKGLYVTAETYFGKHGYSLRMDGEESTNSEARGRSIVIHGASYMTKQFIRNVGRAGRSHGCPAVDSKRSKALIDKLKNGSLYYIYSK